MKEEIAKLNIIGVKPNGEKINITARIGKPYPVTGNEETDEWACPISLTPLYNRLHDAHGTGPFQALCLATNLILDLLRGFKEKAGILLEDDGTEFPLEAYWFGNVMRREDEVMKKVRNFCCERFGEFYESGEIHYAYEKHGEIDETEWIIDGFAHLYFCPFCGAFIKGYGFGNFDQKYPPIKGSRIFRQTAE